MKQFILHSQPDKNGEIRLLGKDFHYLTRVRRLTIGSVFSAVSPDGALFCVTIQSIDHDSLRAACVSLDADDSEKAENSVLRMQNMPKIILFQALPKGAKMD
jgi:16S rRNA (uracil1498-N3)-methyltransferase